MLMPLEWQLLGHLPNRQGVGTVKEFAHETGPLIKFDVAGLKSNIWFFDKGYDVGVAETRLHGTMERFPVKLIYTISVHLEIK